MSQPLRRLLHLEDNQNYSMVVESKLEEDGFAPEMVCVETRGGFSGRSYEQGGFDLIIADYFLPAYDGLQALKLAQEKQPNTPILLVSGTIGEEAAIESLKAGATDYVLKHCPERLVPAVRRALREAEDRRSRVRAETTLVRREKHFRAVSENSLDIVSLLDRDGGNFTYNTLPRPASGCWVMTRRPLIGSSAFSLVHDDGCGARARSCRSNKALKIPNQTFTITCKFRARAIMMARGVIMESICKSMLD